MKILHVIQGYYPTLGGTEFLFQRISEELVSTYKDEVTVFTTNCYNVEGFNKPRMKCYPSGWKEINGVKVRRFPVSSHLSQLLWEPQRIAYLSHLPGNQYLRTWAHGPIVQGLEKAIREYPADVIVASSFPLLHMFTALKAAKATRRGIVYSGHIHPEDDWSSNRPMIYKAIREANQYISLTEYEREYVISNGADRNRTHVLGVGVSPEPYMAIDGIAAKKRYGLSGSPVIGYIGQIALHKTPMLIEVMPLIWSRFPNVKLLIAGARTTYTTEMEKTIRDWPEAYQKNLKLIYNFTEEEKPWLFNACDIFVYPSAWESFGIGYIEAWAAGKPVIGCRRGAIPWVINSGIDGLLVDYGDTENLAGAIQLLLENPDWGVSLGEAGRKKIQMKYTWKIITGGFREVYQKAIMDNEYINRNMQ
jgi:glycosyltransferase involved in cell wall biosynthesis